MAIVLIFALTSGVMAASNIGTVTLLDAVTATGAGAGLSLEGIIARHTFTIVWSGTTPTNTVVALEGTIDGVTWASLATVTATGSGTMAHIVDKPVMMVRANYVSKSGGDATTAVTVKYIGLRG